MTETIITTIKDGDRICSVDATPATMEWTAIQLLEKLSQLPETRVSTSDKLRYASALSAIGRR